MYKKSKCRKCKYHAKVNGLTTCDYAIKSANGSCLKRKGKEIIDIRGGDRDNCLLYDPGKPARDLRHIVL